MIQLIYAVAEKDFKEQKIGGELLGITVVDGKVCFLHRNTVPIHKTLWNGAESAMNEIISRK